jgi:hypothetical protein
MSALLAAANSPAETAQIKCRLCTCFLSDDPDDDPTTELCGACKVRPEARRLGIRLASNQRSAQAPSPARAAAAKSAREFTTAERAMISKVHGFMPPQQLLDLLNERLFADLGPDVVPYSLDQLDAAIRATGGTTAQPASSWAGLRKLIVQARRSGVLAKITEQVIDDFAVVYGLNAKQVLVLKDTLLSQVEDAE